MQHLRFHDPKITRTSHLFSEKILLRFQIIDIRKDKDGQTLDAVYRKQLE